MISLSTIAPATSSVAPSDDAVIHLRQWATVQAHVLPQPPRPVCFVRSPTAKALQLADRGAADARAELVYERQRWWIRDVGHARRLRQDGEWRQEIALLPGVEISIGTMTLIAESPRSIALREFCARILGWGPDRMPAVDHALRAIRLAAARRSPLVIRGDGDMVPLAHALHRQVHGVGAPFVVCDRRRGNLPASVRSPANRGSGVAAFEAAAGGSLCVRSNRPPHDLREVMRLLHEPDHRVQLVVCVNSRARGGLVTGPMPIEVPPLSVREAELPRIVQAYADDAIAAQHAETTLFTDEDCRWVMAHAATSLSEIEKATIRIVALKLMDNVHQAAAVLGMAPVSLCRWLGRRAPHTVPARRAVADHRELAAAGPRQRSRSRAG